MKRADGTGSATLLHATGMSVLASAWSPDGSWLVFTQTQTGSGDIYGIRPEIDSVPLPLVATEFIERTPALSPDGRWLAYSSDRSGTLQVYVQPFPSADDAVWQVSDAGGLEPKWAQNGRELFYVNGNQEMVVAEFETSPTFRRLAEHVLFSVAEYDMGLVHRNYAVSHDDQRFLIMKEAGESVNELTLVLNFFEVLKQRVGNGND